MKRIILDTSFLLVPYQFKVDIIRGIEEIADIPYGLFILDRTIDEIESIIRSQKGADRDAARFALEIIRKERISVIPTENKTNKNVDDLLVEQADWNTDIVATQDKELKKRLREKKVRIIGLRQKNHLKID